MLEFMVASSIGNRDSFIEMFLQWFRKFRDMLLFRTGYRDIPEYLLASRIARNHSLKGQCSIWNAHISRYHTLLASVISRINTVLSIFCQRCCLIIFNRRHFMITFPVYKYLNFVLCDGCSSRKVPGNQAYFRSSTGRYCSTTFL